MSDENKVVYEVRLSKSVKRVGFAVAFGLCLNATVYVFDFVEPAYAMSNNELFSQIVGFLDGAYHQDLEIMISRLNTKSCG